MSEIEELTWELTCGGGISMTPIGGWDVCCSKHWPIERLKNADSLMVRRSAVQSACMVAIEGIMPQELVEMVISYTPGNCFLGSHTSDKVDWVSVADDDWSIAQGVCVLVPMPSMRSGDEKRSADPYEWVDRTAHGKIKCSLIVPSLKFAIQITLCNPYHSSTIHPNEDMSHEELCKLSSA